MNRKYLPLILMLLAGAVTCVITFVRDYTILGKLGALFIVFVVFFILGNILRSTLDFFEKQNEKFVMENLSVMDVEKSEEIIKADDDQNE